jgi:hypothetical protein
MIKDDIKMNQLQIDMDSWVEFQIPPSLTRPLRAAEVNLRLGGRAGLQGGLNFTTTLPMATMPTPTN